MEWPERNSDLVARRVCPPHSCFLEIVRSGRRQGCQCRDLADDSGWRLRQRVPGTGKLAIYRIQAWPDDADSLQPPAASDSQATGNGSNPSQRNTPTQRNPDHTYLARISRRPSAPSAARVRWPPPRRRQSAPAGRPAGRGKNPGWSDQRGFCSHRSTRLSPGTAA